MNKLNIIISCIVVLLVCLVIIGFYLKNNEQPKEIITQKEIHQFNIKPPCKNCTCVLIYNGKEYDCGNITYFLNNPAYNPISKWSEYKKEDWIEIEALE